MNGSVKLSEAPARGLLSRVEGVLFGHRRLVLASLAVFTLIMGWFAVQLRMDAGFEKQLPLGHEYIKTFEAYRNDLLGANRLTIVVKARQGDIWSAPGLKRLYDVTQAVTFLPGVSRSSVRSLWTPNAFVNEITEEGFRADPLVPGTVSPDHLDDQIIATIANSTAQGGFIGTLVSRDQSSAMITVELNEYGTNGAHLDYVAFNHRLEKEIRQQFEDGEFEVQIIGFAKQIGDIADGASAVLEFCLLALLLTAGAVYWYCHSLRFTLLALVCSLASLVWQFGSLRLLGYGLDPLAVLVPFLVFAIGVSHGVQQINFIVREIAIGKSAEEAARSSFTGLLIPGTLALVTALVSFVTLLLIPIPMVREVAITASLGVAYKIITNLLMLPLLASMLRVDDRYAAAQEVSRQRRTRWLRGLARLAEWRNAQWVLGVALVVFLVAIWQSHDRVVGSLQAGAPELREDSRFNRDAVSIATSYDIGLDWLSVVFEANQGASGEGEAAACEDVAAGQYQDRFVWAMQGVPGVLSVASFSSNMRQFNEGYNEGNPKMAAVPIDPMNYAALATEVARTPGLVRTDCSMSAVHLYLADHKATTINRVVDAAKAFRSDYPQPGLSIRLASGNSRRSGRYQRRSGEERNSHAAVCLCRDRAAGVRRLPRPAGSAGLLPAFDHRHLHRLLVHEGTADRPDHCYLAGDGVGRGHWCRLRLLHLQPAATAPGPRPVDHQGGRARIARGGRCDDLHRHYPGGGRGYLGVLGAQVPGRHGQAAGLHVHRQHGHGHDRAAGLRGLAGAGIPT